MVEGSRKWSGSFTLAYMSHTLVFVSSGIAGFAVSLWLSTVVFPGEQHKAALAAALSAVNLAIAVPSVLGAPIAGSWVDGHDRKGTLLASTAGLAGIYGVAAVLMMMSASSPQAAVVPLVILIALRSIAAAFENSAFDTSCAMLLPVDLLPRANGLVQTAMAVSNAASPAFAGAVMTLGRHLPVRPTASGEALVVLVASACAAAGLPFLACARIPSPRRDDLTALVKKSVWKDATEGLKFIRRRSGLLWLLLTFAVVNLASGPLNVLMPLFIRENLMDSAGAVGMDFSGVFGVGVTLFGVGGIAGGLLVSVSGGFRRRRIRGVLYPLIIAQAAMTVLGLTRNVFGALFLIGLMSVCGPVANAHSTAIWQSVTPKAMQGRVFSVRMLIAQFTWPLSAALAGWAGARFRTGTVITTVGLLSLATCILQLGNPAVVSVEETENPKSAA